MTLEQLVHDAGAPWTRYPPAAPSVIVELGAMMPELPADYLEFLALSNGGEGELGIEPGWFRLWPAEEITSLNLKYEVAAFLNGFIAFGSNGADEMLAFAPNGAIATVPFIPMEVAEARMVAPSFTQLVRAFGRSAHAT